MPYKDPEKQRRVNRGCVRKYRHGSDWRGIADYYGLICANYSKDLEDCWGNVGLEFHEPFGEDKWGLGKMQTRILLCRPCHLAETPGRWTLERGSLALLVDDIEAEMEEAGGYYAWVRRYDVGHSLPPDMRPSRGPEVHHGSGTI